MPAWAHRKRPAPEAERDQDRVHDQEPYGKIVANQATHKPSWGEYLIQPGHIFLDGVCPLGENQEKKNELDSVFHESS